jgi:NADH:ubiquinone oxidoreductase subunit 3 (subunit A)
MQEYLPLASFLFLGAFMAGAAMLTAKLIAFESKPNIHKNEAYECGVETFGDARIQFKVGYYLFALLFMVFDIEALFLFPCATVFRKAIGGVSGLTTAIVMADLGLFIFILGAGLVYAWRKGALKWG